MKHLNENSMKKCFLLMAGIILLVFAACQSDELANVSKIIPAINKKHFFMFVLFKMRHLFILFEEVLFK